MAARKKRKPGRGRSTRGASGLFARFLRIVSTFTAALTLSGCLSSDPTKHDRLELENISVANIVPKSSPTAFVATFAQFCEAESSSSPPGLPERLRKAGYVEAPRAKGSRFRHFVVDDRRPAVTLANQGGTIFCAVTALARTGQFDRVGRHVADRFPDARKIDATRISSKAERAWKIGADGATLIYTLRDRQPGAHPSYSLVYWQRGRG